MGRALAVLCMTLAACGAMLAGACGAGSSRPRSAILITLDTTNPDALDCYGEDRGLTPRLAALAAEGLVFDQARSVAPLTFPAHASMMTGLWPPRHGVRENGHTRLPAAADTVAERARSAGYRTGAFVAAAVLAAQTGLDQGFEVYDEPRGEGLEHVQRSAMAVTRAALAWIEGLAPHEPFFLWVHYFDPHAPYAPPEDFAARAAPFEYRGAGGAAYLGEVAFMDHAIGRLLDGLDAGGRLAEAFVVVAGDHGEALGMHGEKTHGMLCYDSVLRVPLIVRAPEGERAGERSAATTSVTDVHPTLMRAMGLGAPSRVDGLDLLGELPEDRGVWLETYSGYLNYGFSPIAGWATARAKYLHGARPQLFDLRADPQELEDRIAVAGAQLAAYRAAMAAVADAPGLAPDESAGVDPELQARVRALGYAGLAQADAELPHPLGDHQGLPEARDHVQDEEAFYRAWDLLARGDRLGAIGILRGVVEERPGNVFAACMLGSFLHEADLHPEAVEAFERFLALDPAPSRPRDARVRHELGRSLAALGRWREAEAQLALASALAPEDAARLADWIEALERTGAGEEAERQRRRLAELARE